MTKTDKLILVLLLAFTAFGTAGLVDIITVDNGLPLLIRQIAAVGFTDGCVLYWHGRRNQYRDSEQRKWANIMLWAGVGVVLFFTLVYGGISALGDSTWMHNEMRPFIIAGMELFTGTPAEVTALLVTAVIGLQAAGTLAAILYIAQIDPATLQSLQQKEAEEAIAKRQAADYKTAQEIIAPIVGQAQALTALRNQLTALGYTEKERERMVLLAAQNIQANKADVTPSSVTIPADGVTVPGAEVGTPVPFWQLAPKR